MSPGGPARIRPGRLRDLGVLIWLFTRIAGRVTGTPPPGVFTTLGRGRGLFWGWLHYSARLMPGGRLTRRQTELVILRVAHVRGSAYEWRHHERLSRRAGVSTRELDLLRGDLTDPGWAPADRALLTVVDAIVTGRDVDDATWDLLRSVLDDRRALEVVLLVTHYDALATTLHVLRVPPDPPR